MTGAFSGSLYVFATVPGRVRRRTHTSAQSPLPAPKAQVDGQIFPATTESYPEAPE